MLDNVHAAAHPYSLILWIIYGVVMLAVFTWGAILSIRTERWCRDYSNALRVQQALRESITESVNE